MIVSILLFVFVTLCILSFCSFHALKNTRKEKVRNKCIREGRDMYTDSVRTRDKESIIVARRSNKTKHIRVGCMHRVDMKLKKNKQKTRVCITRKLRFQISQMRICTRIEIQGKRWCIYHTVC